MRVFSVCGFSKSGKTTTIINLIPNLIQLGYSVGTVKDIHFDAFTMDTEGKNTYLHRKAGATIVTARGKSETDILHYKTMSLQQILYSYNTDFVVVEGMKTEAIPKIVTASTTEQLQQLVDDTTIAISGVISSQMSSYQGIPVIDATTNAQALIDIVLDKVYGVLPLMDSDCCNKCGSSCYQMCCDILSGSATLDNCLLAKSKVQLTIDGNNIEMVPFVQKILSNNVLAITSQLNGYVKGKQIVVTIKE